MLFAIETELLIRVDVLPEQLHLLPVFDNAVTDRIFEMTQAAPRFQIASNPPTDKIRQETQTIPDLAHRHSQ